MSGPLCRRSFPISPHAARTGPRTGSALEVHSSQGQDVSGHPFSVHTLSQAKEVDCLAGAPGIVLVVFQRGHEEVRSTEVKS